jgi:hypothetical protein
MEKENEEELEPLFTGRDLEMVESLVYEPDLEPGYDILRGCLAWMDEGLMAPLTPAAHRNLQDLIVARSYIQEGRDFSEWTFGPDRFRRVWKRALKQGFRWPGFKRLTLTDSDKAFLELKRQNEEDGVDY